MSQDDFWTLRQKHKTGTFLTVIPGVAPIPWKRLPLSDYISFTTEAKQGRILASNLEDEIFRKCVLDSSLSRQLDYLPAGIVSIVAQNIIQASGPTGIDSFNSDLELARQEILASDNAVIHNLVEVVTSVFPYKPEEVYAMDYETFCLRIVQAEKRLLTAGMIKEPIDIRPKEEPKKRKKVDALKVKELFEEQQRAKKQKETPQVSRQPLKDIEGTGKWWKVSPVLETAPAQKEKINFKLESKEINAFAMSGWDKQDAVLNQAKMVEDAKVIYKDVLASLAKKKRK